MEPEIQDLLVQEQIRQVLQRYCRAVNCRAWPLVAASYHSDAEDDHCGYSGGAPGRWHGWSGGMPPSSSRCISRATERSTSGRRCSRWPRPTAWLAASWRGRA
ncbi:nuclear transport factor 2 family protein [Variovorax paradoxus]|nr:nuclear transport factor 2 family protein [Variovorax paradoxus]